VSCARDAILARLPADAPPPHTAPGVGRVAADDPAAAFLMRAAQSQASTEGVADWAAVPGAISTWLRANALPMQVRISRRPALRALDWASDPALTTSFGADWAGAATGVVEASAGVAEFGCVLLRPDADQSAALTLLVDTLLVVIDRAHLHGHLDSLWPLIASQPACQLVLGPSRTGDIEQTMELGAHGPRRMHILLVG